MKNKIKKSLLIFFGILTLLFNQTGFAQEASAPVPSPVPAAETPSSSSEGEQVNVDAIKEKYWARGNETELGVVQNRTYSKKGRFEVGLLGGVIYSDPFLSIQTLGLELAYHLSETIALQVLAMDYFSNPSGALETFRSVENATTNVNNPKGYLGSEVAASVLYGKLSVLGKSIIYYDLHLLGGLGVTNTDSGKYFTPTVGIGQRFYIDQHFSLRVDYRLQYFRETILESQIPAQMGQSVGTRNNWGNTITLGIYYLF